MKYYLLILTIVRFTLVYSQENCHFSINGKIKGLINGTTVYLIKNENSSKADTVMRTTAANEQFGFKGNCIVEGEAYFIKFDTTGLNYKVKVSGYITLLLENRNISVTGSIDKLGINDLCIRGSETHNDLVNYERISVPMIEEINSVYMMIYRETDSLKKRKLNIEMDSLKKEFAKFRWEWIDKNPNSMLTPYLILQASKTDDYGNKTSLDTLRSLKVYNRLTSRVKKGKYGRDLIAEINLVKSMAIGNTLPDITLMDSNEIFSRLQRYLDGNKVILIDIWASWCKPCRETFPNLKSIYTKFKDKGLKIVGISIDWDTSKWKQAIRTDKLPWMQFLDPNLETTKQWGIGPIPASFLLGQHGIIIDKWTGANYSLEAVLEELLN